MVEVFGLDDTTDRHSIELTCPIAGNYRYQVNESPIRSKIFDDYHRLLDGDIEEFNNEFPIRFAILGKFSISIAGLWYWSATSKVMPKSCTAFCATSASRSITVKGC